MESVHITVPVKSGYHQSAFQADAIRPGQTLKLKVLALNGNRALIDFGTFRTHADIKVPVSLGEELLVKILQADSQLNMKLLRSNANQVARSEMQTVGSHAAGAGALGTIQSDLKQVLAQILESSGGKTLPSQTHKALYALNAYFESIDLEKRVSDLLPRLQTQVSNSGIFFEKLLESAILKIHTASDAMLPKQHNQHPAVRAVLGQDLKANLYLLKNIVVDDASFQREISYKSLVTLRKNIDFLLNDILQQQGRAVTRSETAEPFQTFSFTLPLSEDRQTAQLKIYYPKTPKNASKQGFQVSLLLSLDRLGALRTDFYLLDRDLSVTFFVKSQTARQKIMQYQTALQQLLNPLFNQTLLRVVVSEKKIDDFEGEDIQINDDRRVDLRI